MQMLKHLFGLVARGIQDISAYRALARKLRPAITIEVADEADKDWVNRALAAPGEIRPYVPDPLVTDFVAKHGRTILGYVQLVHYPPQSGPYVGHWLFSLYIWPLYRGMGIGQDLCRRVMAQAHQEQARELFLLVYQDARPARALYRKLGFEDTIIPGLAEILEGDTTGRRRLAMRKVLP